MVWLTVYLPAADFYLRIPPVDAFIPINMVFKSSRAPKMGGRCKSRHFGQASQTQTQMTCAIALAKHNDYGLTHTLAPNKRYLNIDIDTTNLEKIINGSKWPWDYERQGATSSTVYSHSKDQLYLPQMQCLLYNPLVVHSQAIYIVFRRL